MTTIATLIAVGASGFGLGAAAVAWQIHRDDGRATERKIRRLVRKIEKLDPERWSS